MTDRFDGASIHYLPEDGKDWAHYLRDKLQEEEYNINCILHDMSDTSIIRRPAKVNVVLFSPELVDNNNVLKYNWIQDLDHKTSVAVRLNVSRSELKDSIGSDVFSVLTQWLMYEAKSTESIVQRLIVAIIGIYEGIADSDDDSVCSEDPFVNDEGGTTFTLSSASSSQASIREASTSSVYDKLPEPRKVPKVYKVLPHYILENEEIFVLVDRLESTNMNVTLDLSDRHIQAELVDKCVYKFSIPDDDMSRGVVGFKVKDDCGMVLGKGNVHRGSRLDQIRDILDEETNPVSLLCQALGIPEGSPQLDEHLVKSVKKWQPFKKLNFFEAEGFSDSDISNSHWPTLLHFAAEYNLLHFCKELLGFPGMVEACVTQNVDGCYPSEIANQHGHTQLENMLIDFLKDCDGPNVKFGLEEDPREDTILEAAEQRKHDSGYNEDEVPPPPPPHISTIPGYIPMASKSENHISCGSPGTDRHPPPPSAHTPRFHTHSEGSNLPPPRCELSTDGYTRVIHNQDGAHYAHNRDRAFSETEACKPPLPPSIPFPELAHDFQHIQPRARSNTLDATTYKKKKISGSAGVAGHLSNTPETMETIVHPYAGQEKPPRLRLRRGSEDTITLKHQLETFNANRPTSFNLGKKLANFFKKEKKPKPSHANTAPELLTSKQGSPGPSKKTKVYTRTKSERFASNRSSSSSESSFTQSDRNSQNLDDSEIRTSESLERKERDKREKVIHKNAKRRQSVRVQHARKQKNLKGPDLPLGKRK